jgi:iron-sulfur cluster assembly protein
MITLTPIAISKITEIIAERDATLCLRIAVVGGGCSGFHYQMTLEKKQEEDDESIEFEGLKVLVDAQSMLLMNGTTVDYVEEKDGSGFTFDNPNSQSGCAGCGSSDGSGGCSTK